MAFESSPSLALIGPSGLDTSAIIDALASVRRNPILRLEAQRARLQRQNTEFGNLRTRLEALRNKAATLDTAAELRAVIATSSNVTALTVTGSGAAAEGTYSIVVNSLAQGTSRIASGLSAQTGVAVGSGTIAITSGGTQYDIALTGTEDLEGVRNAINASAAPVTATIINDGSATDPYKLVITSDTTGAASNFTVDLTGFTPSVPAFTFSSISTGQDASFTVNGVAISRPTNTVTDVIDGVSISLLASSQSSTVTISKDRAGVKAKLKELVAAFNDVIDLFKTHANAENKDTTAILYGDTTLRSAQTAIRGVLDAQVTGTGSTYDTLASVGIRTGSDGRLSVDDTALGNALNSDFEGVISLFTTATNGIASRVQTAALSFSNNSLKTRTDGILARIRGINGQVDRLEERLEQYIETLRKKFSALDSIAGRLQSQGGALASLSQ
jgi:flagellar hook-associated protein 2